MRAEIITCYESNEERARLVFDACVGRGYETIALTSDFSHIRKEKRESVPAGFTAIEARPYRKNLSLSRMLSHRRFAKDAFEHAEKDRPDLIWLMAPANSVIREAKRYKMRFPETKLIIDIIDMWPESLPVNINKDAFPFRIWRKIRRNNIGCCDLLVTECDLYQEILRREYEGEIRTIRWARDSKAQFHKSDLSDDVLSLCYIGSINNIIDADRIADVISKIDMPVKLHVIGDGESRDAFLSILKGICELQYHGVIRDEKKKSEIFDLCHAGINIYKEGLYIGLTVKCIDYFEHGLPIINNIKGDTWKLVEDNNAGINIDKDNLVDAKRIMNMRDSNWNIYQLFEENFTKEVFTEKCLGVIDEVMK
jgi:glycosyltransferase involved in cell wall biosynthesis